MDHLWTRFPEVVAGVHPYRKTAEAECGGGGEEGQDEEAKVHVQRRNTLLLGPQIFMHVRHIELQDRLMILKLYKIEEL